MKRKFSHTYFRQSTVLQWVLAITVLSVGCTTTTTAQWAQWGGPNRNFTTEPVQLAKTWPEEGPKRLWQRTLGEGYSAIAVDEGKLYTMYRVADNEVVVALDAETGEIYWESSYPAPPWSGFNTGYGPGPHSTPLIVGDYVYIVGCARPSGLLEQEYRRSGLGTRPVGRVQRKTTVGEAMRRARSPISRCSSSPSEASRDMGLWRSISGMGM